MTSLVAGRTGLALAAMVALWCWDAMLLRHARPWAGWVPAGLAALFALVLAMRAAARRAPDGGSTWLARQCARLDTSGLVALALALGLVVLFHLGFERAAGDGRAYFSQLHSLVFDRVSFAYDVEPVLRDVSFTARRGEVVALVGASGAGKSTLLKILSAITEPTEGWVTRNGRVASLLEVGMCRYPSSS